MKRIAAHLSLVLAVGVALMVSPVYADDQLADEARQAVSAFIKGVGGGPDTVAPLLAPEYQIVRSNGMAFDRKEYIETGVGMVHARPEFTLDELVATRDGDVMVVRYLLVIQETIGGKEVQSRAPRLTVFRRIDGQWKVVSHANFAKLE